MTGRRTIIIITALSVAVLVLGFVAVVKAQPPQLEKSASASVEVVGSKEYDWGDVDINGGSVERVFQIRNNGESNLEVSNLKTSCMCTQAKFVINGNSSPAFDMHGSSGWKGTIKPKEVAEVRVVFDPLFHGPQAIGPITRFVSFDTGDVKNPTVELKLTGNVVKE